MLLAVAWPWMTVPFTEEKRWPSSGHTASSSDLLVINVVTFPKKGNCSCCHLCLTESSSLSYPQSPHKDAITKKLPNKKIAF